MNFCQLSYIHETEFSVNVLYWPTYLLSLHVGNLPFTVDIQGKKSKPYQPPAESKKKRTNIHLCYILCCESSTISKLRNGSSIAVIKILSLWCLVLVNQCSIIRSQNITVDNHKVTYQNHWES